MGLSSVEPVVYRNRVAQFKKVVRSMPIGGTYPFFATMVLGKMDNKEGLPMEIKMQLKILWNKEKGESSRLSLGSHMAINKGCRI